MPRVGNIQNAKVSRVLCSVSLTGISLLIFNAIIFPHLHSQQSYFNSKTSKNYPRPLYYHHTYVLNVSIHEKHLVKNKRKKFQFVYFLSENMSSEHEKEVFISAKEE